MYTIGGRPADFFFWREKEGMVKISEGRKGECQFFLDAIERLRVFVTLLINHYRSEVPYFLVQWWRNLIFQWHLKRIGIPPSCIQKVLPSPLFPSKNPRCKTCQVFFCFQAIIFLGPVVLTSHWLLCINIVLRHSWGSQLFTQNMSPKSHKWYHPLYSS